MTDKVQKIALVTIAIAASLIAIQLIPVSRKASFWLRCFDRAKLWINNDSIAKQIDNSEKESIAVTLCNGAVYEPKLKIEGD